MADPLVIIGAGQAASQLVASLAQDGFAGEVCLVGDEPHLPYQRPPLSKKFLAGELALDRLYVKPAAFYEKAGSRLLLGRRVERIDRAGRAVLLADGARLPYSTLVLATGSRPRELTCPAPACRACSTCATSPTSTPSGARLAPGKSLVVIGGGYIGLELAAVAAKLGLGVTVLEQAPRLMARGVGPVVSQFYDSPASARKASSSAPAPWCAASKATGRSSASFASDAQYDADIVVVGAGAVPNVELAREAGLAVEDGIVVDAQCRTDDPAIYAIGDCTSQHHDLVGRRLRLESVHNALEQARIAAAAICGRKPPAMQVPWFWTDQYDVKMQMAGLSAGHDQAVVRGDRRARPLLRRVLPARGHADRRRRGQSRTGIHDVQAAHRRARQDRSGAAWRRRRGHEGHAELKGTANGEDRFRGTRRHGARHRHRQRPVDHGGRRAQRHGRHRRRLRRRLLVRHLHGLCARRLAGPPAGQGQHRDSRCWSSARTCRRTRACPARSRSATRSTACG